LDFIIKFAPFFYDVILPLSVGYLLVKYTKLNKNSLDFLFSINLWIVYPLACLFSVWILKIELSFIWLPVTGLLMQIIPMLISKKIVKRYDFNYAQQGSYTLTMSLFNAGTLGALTAFFLLGEAGYGYTGVILVLGNIFIYGYCFPLASKYQRLNEGKSEKISILKKLISLNQLSLYFTIFGIILAAFRVPRPEAVDGFIKPIVHMVAWTAAVPIGAMFDFKKIKQYRFVARDVSIVKFIIVPLVVTGLSFLFIKDITMLKTIFIISASSGSNMAIMMSKIYKLDPDMCLSSFIYSTIVYLLVIVPIFLILFKFIWV
jgi:predicted permease